MRITEKKENGFYELKEGKEIYGEEDGIRLVQIVGRFEDVLDKYGLADRDELDLALNAYFTAVPKITPESLGKIKELADGEGERGQSEMVRRAETKRIPLAYVARAQSLYVRIFGFEDSGGVPRDEAHEYGACKREYDAYMDKMFGDDAEAIGRLGGMFNSTMLSQGTFKPICDMLRSIGYEVLSADNASREEIAACKRGLIREWKERRGADGKSCGA